MTAEAILAYPAGEQKFSTTIPLNSGDVIQLPDGRAAVKGGLTAAASGDSVASYTEGVFRVLKAAGICLLRGGRAYWDRVNGVATFAQPSGAFYIGRVAADAAATDTSVLIDFNIIVSDLIALKDGRWTSTPVKTAGSPAATRDAVGSGFAFSLDNTNEAQKIDAISIGGVRTIDGPILEGRIAIHDKGNNAALTIFLGLASGSNAAAFTNITDYCGFVFVGNSLEINAISTDGTTTVAKTDTTVLAVADTFNEFWLDARNPAAVDLYVDGVLMLTATVFSLAKAAGPLFPLLWVGKTANATTADVTVDFLRLRSTDF